MSSDTEPQPTAPDYAQANVAGAEADVNTLAARRTIDQAAQLGLKGSVDMPGYGTQNYDFTGLSDADLTASQAKGEAAAANTRAQYTLGIAQQYGPQFVDLEDQLVKQSDPQTAALRDQYMTQISGDLSKGATLNDSERREVEQGARAGQAARGNILGNAAAFDEAATEGQAGEALEARRQATVQSALGLAPVSAQFGNINQAQNVYTPNTQMYTSDQTNPNAGNNAAQFALGEFGDQTQTYNTEYGTPNPWMQMAGIAMGTIASVASSSAG